jgi:hypothetical protein
VFTIFNKKTSIYGNFTAITLALGDMVYIKDYTEVPPEMRANCVGNNRMIGRTQEGMAIYAISLEDSRYKIMLTIEMFPLEIFHNAKPAPIQLPNFPVDEVELIVPGRFQSPRNTTRDPAVIKEVIAALTSRKGNGQGKEPLRSLNMHLYPTNCQVSVMRYRLTWIKRSASSWRSVCLLMNGS